MQRQYQDELTFIRGVCRKLQDDITSQQQPEQLQNNGRLVREMDALRDLVSHLSEEKGKLAEQLKQLRVDYQCLQTTLRSTAQKLVEHLGGSGPVELEKASEAKQWARKKHWRVCFGYCQRTACEQTLTSA